jgi:N-acetylmuramic acid 6-phosphate etherase
MANRIREGGTLFYAGAGTSIRIGVQDGSELPATFGMPEGQIEYLIAGGKAAIFETYPDAEDDIEAGATAGKKCGPKDVLIAIAASGTTPYTVAVAKMARHQGALVIAVVNNEASPLAATADFEILLKSGPEVIAGSTRLAAGTAQKATLNMLSTLAHIKLGAVHDGFMVNVQAGNQKLKKRAAGIVAQIAGVSVDHAAVALNQTEGDIKTAIILCAGAKSLLEAKQLLADTDNNLRLALTQLVDR